jgi:hypothetical protein
METTRDLSPELKSLRPSAPSEVSCWLTNNINRSDFPEVGDSDGDASDASDDGGGGRGTMLGGVASVVTSASTSEAAAAKRVKAAASSSLGTSSAVSGGEVGLAPSGSSGGLEPISESEAACLNGVVSRADYTALRAQLDAERLLFLRETVALR